MFTGVVQGVAPIADRIEAPGRLVLALILPEPLDEGLELGMSVAVDGVCLTVSGIKGRVATFDVIQTTLEVTNLSDRRIGDYLNVERSLKLGQENGGHEVTGHVTGVATIRQIVVEAEAAYIRFQVAPADRRYIFDKGFLALNGTSLTVAGGDEGDGVFRVSLVPETLRQTTFAAYRLGDRLNYEVEHRTRVMVDTIERVLTGKR